MAERKIYVFYNGKRELHLEDINIIPVDLALRKLEIILGEKLEKN